MNTTTTSSTLLTPPLSSSRTVPGQGQGGQPSRSYPPDHLQIVHVRLPPHPDDIRGNSNRSRAEQEGGREPAYLHDRELEIHTGIYSHGLLVSAMSKSTGTTRINPGVYSTVSLCSIWSVV